MINFSVQTVALIGSLQLVAPWKHGLKRKNKEAWFDFVKSEDQSGIIRIHKIFVNLVTKSNRHICEALEKSIVTKYNSTSL